MSTEIQKTEPTQVSKLTITPEEMWNAEHNSSSSWGIEGYEVPKVYFDYHQELWVKERGNILNAHKRVWPPENWPRDKVTDKKVPPNRPNYIDEYIKWAKSFNDPKRSEELREQLEPKGIFKPKDPPIYPNMREKFLKWEKDIKERKAALPQIPEWKVNGVDNAKQRMEEAKSKEKTQWEKDKEKYTKEKPQWPRCDRVSIMSDAEYVGERIPFYNTFAKEGETIDKKNLFYPNKEPCLHKAPIWSFQFKKKSVFPNDQMAARESAFKERVENYKSGKNLTDKDLMIDVSRSYEAIRNRGRYPLIIHKPFDYAGTDQYKLNKEQFPEYSPGPDYYWKMVDMDVNERPKQVQEEKEIDGKTRKIYYMNRKRTDFRIYKPMRSSVF